MLAASRTTPTATRRHQQQQQGPQEGIDHLFLLPERVLGMDSAQLRQDLAGLDFNVQLLQTAPQGNVWLSGAAPVDANQRVGSAHSSSRHSSSKGHSGTLHWFAYIGKEADLLQNETLSQDHDADFDDGETYAGTSPPLDFITDAGKEGSHLLQKEREERIRALRDRQNEERQRKLEELKQQALAAQKFREQKEEERRRRIDELRQRDSDRRQQVEERKRQIWEAERDRREAILRKNQEREARIDSKRKNERSSIVFAFGSSTPRMLEPTDTGGSFWGSRRATSTTNVMFAAAPLTRRSSERELDGSKKRATSASGLDRKPGEDMKMSSSMYEVFHWNSTPEPTSKPIQRAKSLSCAPGSEPKTTLAKTDPQLQVATELNLNIDGREHSFSSAPHTPSNRSVHISSILPGLGGLPAGEDGDVSAPGTAVVLTTQQRVNRRKTDLMPTIPSPRDLTPTSSSRPSSVHLQGNHPFSRSPGLRSGEVTPSPPSRPLSALSQQSVNSVNSGVSIRARPLAAPRRPRPISIAVTGVTHESDSQAGHTSHRHSIAGETRTSKTQNLNTDRESAKPPLPKVHATKKLPKSETPGKKPKDKVMKLTKDSPGMTPKTTPLQSPGSEVPPSLSQDPVESREEKNEIEIEKTEDVSVAKPCDKPEQVHKSAEQTDVEIRPSSEETCLVAVESEPITEEKQVCEEVNEKEIQPFDHGVAQEETREKLETAEHSEHIGPEVDMTASVLAKIRITTEEEAKAALAERRRLAREQAEREAELEKLRLEEEQRLEKERLHKEEEEQRRFEEEQLRLVEEARRAEEERLLQAIQENERREEDERKRREEEAKAKAEKEEAEKKAREEAERLRREMNERLKKEEEERIARRKRVEAIMLRTRGKGSTPSNTPTKGEGDSEEGKEGSPLEESKLHVGEAAAAMLPGSKLDMSGEDISTGNGQQSLLVDSFSTDFMDHVQENGSSAKKLSSSSSSDLLLIDNVKPMETSEDLITSETSILPSPPQSNGHRNGVEYDAVDFVNVDNVKQNNTTNNLLDFSQFDAFSTNNVMLNDTQQSTAATEFEQILELGSVPTTGKLSNEDNINSNVMNNGPSPPFIAFQENMAKKTDSNSVTDLLS